MVVAGGGVGELDRFLALVAGVVHGSYDLVNFISWLQNGDEAIVVSMLAPVEGDRFFLRAGLTVLEPGLYEVIIQVYQAEDDGECIGMLLAGGLDLRTGGTPGEDR